MGFSLNTTELCEHGKPAGIWSTVNHLGKLGEHRAANAKEESKLRQYYQEMEQLLAIDWEPDHKKREEMKQQLRDAKYPATWGEFRKKWKDRRIIVYDRDGNKTEIRPLANPDKIHELFNKPTPTGHRIW